MYIDSRQIRLQAFLLCVGMLFIFALPVGCQRMAYEQTRSTNSIEAYEAFLKRYPESPYKAEAQTRLEEISWLQARSKESTLQYKIFLENFLKKFPMSKHAEEARTRLRVLEFQAVSRADSSAKSKQEFITRYSGTEEAAAISKDLRTMAIVDLEYPASVEATYGPTWFPRTSVKEFWHYRIIFHERNGIPARIKNTALIVTDSVGRRWRDPTPSEDVIYLPAMETRSYSSWVRGSLERGSLSITFKIEDDNGHSSIVTAIFTLE